MPKYVNVDEILHKLPDDLPYKASVKRVLIQAPDADVVPKSEVERLQAEIDRLQKHNTEFARKHYEDGYNTAKTDVASEIFEDLQGLLIMRIGVNQAIAELKKKYTEEKK